MIDNALFGMYKEMWIENNTQLREALQKWDQHKLHLWLQKMEKGLLTFNYEECLNCLDEFQPNYIQNLPQGMSVDCNKIRKMIKENQSQYGIVSAYLHLLRNLQKALQTVHVSTNLYNSIRNLELFLSSPINSNAIKAPSCECQLI